MLLCCSAGPTGDPGWIKAAPLSRIWCLYELYVAFDMKIPTVIQFGVKDEIEFRAALLKEGMTRVATVLEGIDASAAEATLSTDREMILLEIENSMGLDAFNQLIRIGMAGEYRSLAKQGLR